MKYPAWLSRAFLKTIRVPGVFALGVVAPVIVVAASSNWNITGNGNWNSAGSWDANGIPGSTTGTDSTDVATFGITLTAGRTVTVDANRNIGGIVFENSSAFAYSLSGGNLLLSDGGLIRTGAGNGDHTDIIGSAIAIQGDGGSATFSADAASPLSLLRINGAVTGVSTAGNTTTLNLAGSNTGGNSVTSVIGDGAAGGKLAVVKSGAGTWNLTAGNTFSGGLGVKEGMVVATNSSTSSLGTGVITLGDISGNASATLATTTNGLTYANAIVLATNSSSGALTIQNSGATTSAVAYSGGVTGTNNLVIANNAGTSGTMTFSTNAINNAGTVTSTGTSTGTTTISGGIGSNVTGVIQNSATSALTVSGALTVNAGGTTLANSSGGKALTVSGAIGGTGDLILQNNSALASGVTLSGGVNHTGAIINSGSGAVTPAIVGTTNLSYDRSVLISGVIGSNVTTVTQNSATSSMELSAANTFTGGSRVFAGALILGNATAAGAADILLGDTSGAADASLLVRGAAGTITIANNIVVQAGSSGTATLGAAAGGSGGGSNVPVFSGSVTLNKDVTLSPFNGNLTITGAIGGTGGIIVSNFGQFASTSGQAYGVGGGNVNLSKADLANTFSGDVRIRSGSLTLTGSATANASLNGLLGTGTNAVIIGDSKGSDSARLIASAGATGQSLSRNLVVQAGSGGVAGVGVTGSQSFTFSGGLELNKSVYFLNGISGVPTITYSGAITEGSSALGGTAVVSSGGNVVRLTNTGNTYDGGSIAGGIGTLWGSGAGALGSGNAVAELGFIRLSDQVALASGKKVHAGPFGGVSIGANSASQISYVAGVLDSSSSGAVMLGVSISNAIDLSAFGNGLMYLGSESAGLTYSASTLGANTDGNYRLGFGRQTLTVSSGALTGASAKLIVGVPSAVTLASAGQFNTTGLVSLTATNTYGGGTEINTGSTLQGTQRTIAGESPFGSSTGAMTLHGATLRLQNNTTSANGTSVGAFAFDGNSTVQVDGVTGGGNSLTVGEITRVNRGVLSIITSGTGASYGSTAFLKTSGTAPATTTGKVTGGVDVQMVAPYFVEGNSGGFLSYDATNGFMPITTGYNTTNFSSLPTNAIVRLTTSAATVAADTTILALGLVPSATQTLIGGGDRTLTITSGGIYMDGRTGSSQSATIGSGTAGQRLAFNFDGKEAIINVSTSNNSALTIAGNIHNADGLTKSGNAGLILTATGSTFEGPITILGSANGSYVGISNDLNLGGSGNALNNGVVLDGGRLQISGVTTLSSARTLTIGANGGSLNTFNGGNFGANFVTIASKITGSNGGTLSIYGSTTGGTSNTVTNTFTFTNTANDFTAPIFIGNAYQSGLMALLFDTDSQLGNAANSVSLIGGNSALRYTGSGAITSNRAINFYDLGGGLEVSSATGEWTNSGVLAGSGVFNKMGSGKLVLTGDNTYTGATIIGAGVLNVRHAGALGATTAAITGDSGVSGGAVHVQSGAALEVQGGVALGNAGGKTLYLNGTGIGSAGALRSVGGANSNSGAVVLQSTTTIGVDAGSLSLSGAVSGAFALSKVGAGVLALSGANTFSGGLTVSEGTLLVNNTTGSGTGSGALFIASGATLGGSGSVGGAATIAGSLNPGNSPGVITFNDAVTFQSGSAINIEIVGAGARGTDYDGINFNGGLTISGGTLTFNIASALADGSVLNIFDGTALTGLFTSVVAAGTGGYSGAFTLDGGAYTAVFGSQTVSLNLASGELSFAGSMIPEPASFATIAAALALGVGAVRRRRV